MANGETIAEHRLDAQGADPLMLTGVNDQNVQELKSLFGIRVVMRGEDEGIPTPCNAILHGLVKGIEKSSSLD